MNKLPKEILNYFATFTETRFNFRRLINYKWTNNELTLDLSLFPSFQTLLLNKVKTGDLAPITIKQNQYAILISKEAFQTEIEALLQNNFNKAYLDQCLSDEDALIAQNKAFIADTNGEIVPAQDNEAGRDLLARQKALALKDGIRTYNLALRRAFEKALNNLQDKVVQQKKEEFHIEYTPSSIFGVANYVNQKFEQIKAISNNFTDSENYIKALSEYFTKTIDDIVIYDLYYNLQKYGDFTKLGTLYLFFHMLENSGEAFPLYFVEVEYRTSSSEVTLSFPRNLMLLNTPAVNYFKYDSVLTVPRASSIVAMNAHLGAMETFIQTQYGFQTPFITEPSFNRITHADNKFPAIKNRIGFQTITNEDKKLLDYSELMTKMEMNEEGKFSDFIDQYVRGAVPNHQEEVDKKYLEKYSIKSPQRYISESPLPLNNSQKRILLALAHEKNHIIVVDGPPGTGKSHTIAALTYWANENKKSVVITSHKQEALDVIDRMLTDKYKSLHPQAKPSIVRMDKETGSANNLQNTLTNSVVGAASNRALEYNREATENDEKKQSENLIRKIEDKLRQAGCYEEMIQKIIQFDYVDQELAKDAELASILATIKQPDQKTDFPVIQDFLDSGVLPKLDHASLEEYAYLLDQKTKIPEFLKACEELNRIPEADRQLETSLAEIPASFSALLEKLKMYFQDNIKISAVSTKHTTSGFFKKLLGKAPKEEELQSLLETLSSLQFASVLKEIAHILNMDKENVTIRDLTTGLEKIRLVLSIRKYKGLLAAYRALPGNQNKNIGDIYEAFRKLDEFKELLTLALYQALQSSFQNYGPLLLHFGITRISLEGLAKLKGHDEKIKHAWQWIQLHGYLSEHARTPGLHLTDIQNYYRIKQKEIENLNDQRLKNLNNHLGEMARIKVSYEGGKRFSMEEAKVLLDGVSCIIAEPGTISRHFPMEEGLIDVLIIDEASQVSIADSISLILRAKQVVIFGDEYQYGAVSATNVNARYSASYFAKIINAFADDYNTTVTAAAEKELVDEVSKEISPDDQVSDTLLKPQDGTVLWLKTFNIRTSTLTFAKAIANYTTSLKEHFRSFPEIISYSNDHFYKEAQMELTVNRIRTKPISDVLQFISVETQGKASPNTNLDEIEAIANDIKKRLDNGFKGTIGIITSFKEQQARMEQSLNERFNMAILRRDHKLAIWFVGDVQGEERDIVYYSFVEDKKLKNANLASIYPVLEGTADNIRSLKMQRLNVGFSRAKDTMIFVMSQPVEQFSNTRLGDALKHYASTLELNKKNDFFIENEAVFESPMEKKLYALLLETSFVQERREHIKIIPQFDIGKYIAAEYNACIPKYRADFLLTYAKGGKEETLILEYDGLEYHFQNPRDVNNLNFSQSYLDYDTQRQMELESYGYRFLRINKFNLRPQTQGQTEKDVLNQLLQESFN
ncbi:MAG: superfamily I DNA and RNA helicase and helicase subunit [Syntrophaceae bacterium]|nr:MAG: superfamily I DNA and RNA helicase and helicase subunit [Syntrophaceae bacterium]